MEFYNLYGSLANNIPETIIDYKIDQNNNLSFLVVWKEKNGKKPIPTYVCQYELEKKNNTLLFQFYQNCFKQYAMIRKIASSPVNTI